MILATYTASLVSLYGFTVYLFSSFMTFYIRPNNTHSMVFLSPPPPPAPTPTHPTLLPVLPGPLCAQPGLRRSGEAEFSFS